MSKIRKHIFAEGRVQGVGFRASINYKARELHINGWVKNLYDGRVEAIFTGSRNNVEKMIKYLRKGPRFSRVDSLEIINEEFTDEFKSFNIKY